MTDWRENTGVVPPEVGPDTVVEVEYRDGLVLTWGKPIFEIDNNDPDTWGIEGDSADIIRWRIPA